MNSSADVDRADQALMAERNEYARWDGYQWVKYDPAEHAGVTRGQMNTLNVLVGMIAVLALIWSIVAALIIVRVNEDANHPQCIITSSC